MRAVLRKDRVKAADRASGPARPSEGASVEIIERPEQPIIGRLLHEGGVWLVAPEDKRYGQDVRFRRARPAPRRSVKWSWCSSPSRRAVRQPVGGVKEVLGEIDDPGMEIEIAVRKYGVPHEFSGACLARRKAIPDKVRPADKHGRIDLTDVPLVTIDGEDARHFDDAVSRAGQGRPRQGRNACWSRSPTSSAYVRAGSAIDIDAYNRATSVYLPRRVIPMLPEQLSNGLARSTLKSSVFAHGVRHALAADGEIYAYQFYPAVMWSHARFTYTEVAAILGNTRGPGGRSARSASRTC